MTDLSAVEKVIDGLQQDWYEVGNAEGRSDGRASAERRRCERTRAALMDAIRGAIADARTYTLDPRDCTCHPDDNPPRPCPRKFALSECRLAALSGSAGEAGSLEKMLDDFTNAAHSDGFGAYEEFIKLRAEILAHADQVHADAYLKGWSAAINDQHQRAVNDAAPRSEAMGSAGEAVCERCEGVGVVPVNGQNRFCPDCNPEGRGPKVEPTLYMLVGKDGHREARVFYSYNKDTLADFDAMRPANAPHRFVPLYEHPARADLGRESGGTPIVCPQCQGRNIVQSSEYLYHYGCVDCAYEWDVTL